MDHCPPSTPPLENSPLGSDSMRRLVQPGVNSDSMLALMDKHALPHPYWYAPRVMLYRGDCEEIAPMLRKVVDALITDPPYGMGLDTDFSGMNGWGGKGHKYEKIIGDDAPFDPTPWLRYGKAQVLWGAQYFCHKLPQVGGWMVFNKRGDGKPSEICFGDAELAWKNTGKAVRMFSAMWHGVARWSSEGRLHPTQKPVALMGWCMDQAKVPQNALVLDPFMGSGTTGIAALRTGRRFIGIEKDPTHFKTAMERIQQELAQGDLFHGPNAKVSGGGAFPPSA